MELVIFAVLITVGFVVGRAREQAHLRALNGRELMSDDITVTALDELPGATPTAGKLVHGEAVIATDYFKTIAASLRTLVGGEVKSYSPLMERARREARQRMVDTAQRWGATGVVNVRFATSDVGGGNNATQVEVLCYGTAVK